MARFVNMISTSETSPVAPSPLATVGRLSCSAAPSVQLDLDRTVCQLYRAATAEVAWEPVLDALCADLGARALTLQTVAASNGRLLGLHQGGTDLADSTLDYLRQWHQVDPLRANALSAEHARVGGWLHSDEWLDDRMVRRQPYFRHYLPARGSMRSAHLAVQQGTSQITGLAIEWPRHRAALTGDERLLLERLGRHLRDALQAHERLRRLLPPAAVGRHLLEAMPQPHWLLGECGMVRFANAAAGEEEARGDQVVRLGQRLCLAKSVGQREFETRLAGLCGEQGPARELLTLGERAEPATWLLLQRLDSIASLGAFVLPKTGPVVLAALFNPARMAPLDAQALAAVFGFTPAEARVAVLVAQAQTAEEIAEELGLMPSTARTHLRQVLAKMGVPRKVDAVRMLVQGGWCFGLPRGSTGPE